MYIHTHIYTYTHITHIHAYIYIYIDIYTISFPQVPASWRCRCRCRYRYRCPGLRYPLGTWNIRTMEKEKLLYFKMKEFDKWHVQEGLSNLLLKQVIKPSCERCLSYTWRKGTSLYSRQSNTEKNLKK